jgi:hypothetical protein
VYVTVKEEVALMGRRKQPYTIKVTHRYVVDPEAVERGLQAWAMFLAEHLRKKMAEELQEQQHAEETQ